MKITLFEKTKEMFQNKFSLKRPNLQDEVIASYFVNMKEAYTNTTYYYVRTKDGKEALYFICCLCNIRSGGNRKIISGAECIRKIQKEGAWVYLCILQSAWNVLDQGLTS